MQIFIHFKTTLHISGVTAPIIRGIKSVPAASGTGHTTCTATPLQRGLIGTGFCESSRLAQTSPDQTTLEGSSGTST